MSSVPPGGWGPDDTGAVPVGPEPEPTGAGGAGSGGWGESPRTEPFAIAALVWAVASIILPIVGTIVALVLAARASDSIRRSQGTRSGMNLVNAARIVAGVVIALWAIGGIVYLATRDDSSSSVVAPTQPTSASTTTSPSTTTTRPLTTTTTTRPPVTTTTQASPVTSLLPPPPSTTAPPTTTTAPPSTTAASTSTTSGSTTTSSTTTTSTPTTTTSPERGEEARITEKLLSPPSGSSIGPSNRGLPDDERVVVSYTIGQPLVITWGINNGAPPLPTGTATCTSPPRAPSSTTSSTSSTSSTSTPLPPSNPTAQLARTEAKRILTAIKSDIQSGKLDVTGVQLIGTYPIQSPGGAEADVVQSFYSKSAVLGTIQAAKVFTVPDASDVQCLNPAFD